MFKIRKQKITMILYINIKNHVFKNNHLDEKLKKWYKAKCKNRLYRTVFPAFVYLTYMLFISHNNNLTKILILYPFYKWWNQGWEMLCN